MIRYLFFAITLSVLISQQVNSQEWFQQNSGAPLINLQEVRMLNANTAFVAGSTPDLYGWVFRTTNAGVNWTASYWTTHPYTQITAISFSSLTHGTAVGGGILGGSAIVRTNDGGASWVTQSSGTNFNYFAVQMTDDNTGYVAGQQGSLLKTTNGGLNWLALSSTSVHNLLGISFVNNNTGYLVGNLDSILKTTNGGVNWTRNSPGGPGTYNDIFMLNANTGMAVGSSGRIIKTTNAGTFWQQLNSGVTSALRGVHYINANVCFVVGDSGKVLKTTNGGINWMQQNSTLTENLRGVSFIDASTGTAVGYNGKIIRTTNAGVTFIQPVSGEIPNEFSFSQNYPNPFNPTTNIKFQIPKSGFVNMAVYDVLGREVTTLVNEELKPGTYEADWNASNYPSGVYYYRLTAGDFSQTKKMVLVK